MIDILYLSHNRREYTETSLPVLLANTSWDLVRELVVIDDGSTDGTGEFLIERLSQWYKETGRDQYRLHLASKLGGPVAAMNEYLSIVPNDGRAPFFAKIDNDILVPPLWLEAMAGVIDANPSLDVLGMEPGFGTGVCPPDLQLKLDGLPFIFERAPHIGGVGLFRREAFERYGRPVADGRFGFTEWQTQNEDLTIGWISPDICVPQLDRLPFEPWRSLAARYAQEGNSRPTPWPAYAPASELYWRWFAPDWRTP